LQVHVGGEGGVKSPLTELTLSNDVPDHEIDLILKYRAVEKKDRIRRYHVPTKKRSVSLILIL